MCKHFDLKVLEAGGLEWISMKPVGHLVLFLDKFFASVVATLFGCVNNFYLGAVVSVVCPPMLRLLSAAPCPHHRVPATALHSLRGENVQLIHTAVTHLCCAASIPSHNRWWWSGLKPVFSQTTWVMFSLVCHCFLFHPFKKYNNNTFTERNRKVTFVLVLC